MSSAKTALFFSELKKHKVENKAVEFFDNYAKGYEIATKDAGYNKIIDYSAMFLKNLLLEESSGIPVEQFEILDVGCGSGMTGEALQKAGFEHFDGVDPSQGMLDIAKEKKVYRNLFKAKLTETERFDMEDGLYDAVLCTFCIGKSCIKTEQAIPEFLRLLKDGGIAVYTISPTIDKTKALEEHLKYFYEGKFELLKIERKCCADQLVDHDGNCCHIYGVRKL